MKYAITILMSLFIVTTHLNADALHEVIYSDSDMQERFYPLGFGKNRFAYIKHMYEAGIGNYFWQLTVVDLITDMVITTEKVLSSGEDDKTMPSGLFKAS